MATLAERLIALASAIGADIKALTAKQGDLTALSTTAKGSLVAAINEIKTALGSTGAVINDLAGNCTNASNSWLHMDSIVESWYNNLWL